MRARNAKLADAFAIEQLIKVHVGDARILAVAEGNGPVNALDAALRKAVGSAYPALAHIHLTDYRVRVLDTAQGTGAVQAGRPMNSAVFGSIGVLGPAGSSGFT